MQLIFAFVLTVAALVAASLFLWPSAARLSTQPMVYAPLSMALLVLVALLAPTPLDLVHKGAIVLGLVLALPAMVFFTIEGTPPTVGFAQLLLTYLLYFVASAVLTSWAWPTPWELLVLLIAGLLYWQLAPRLHDLWGVGLGYLLILSLMLWQAVQLWAQSGRPWAVLGLSGALLLVLANAVLALDTWVRPVRGARILAPLAFFAGNSFVAWSAWGASTPWLQ